MKLTIEKVIYGGQGLAKVFDESTPRDGMRVFVPFTLPGEIVEAVITEEQRGYCFAEAQQIQRVSEFRVEPPCPWFGACGGCQLQHSLYNYQVELKREMLAESLTRAGVRELPPVSALTGKPFGYRNRIRLQIQSTPNFSIGYRKAKSHLLTAIDHCMIAAPLLEKCIVAVRGLGQQGVVPTETQEMELFTNHDQSELLLTIWTRPNARLKKNPYTDFFQQLHLETPQLSGAAVFPAEKDRGGAARAVMQWGLQSLRYTVTAREYTVSLGSFFQVNSTLLDHFVEDATSSEKSACAWDLYAGVGLFSLALTDNFERVISVESSPSACNDLRLNLQGTKATPIRSTTLRFLQQAVQEITQRRGPAPDLVLLDPPRVGAGIDACNLLARCNPRRIVYVSCDPATLGRDLAALIQSGYRLHRLQLVDMFPQTHHLETIATLYR